MNWAIECNGTTDYLPGAPWNKTAAEAERVWRQARHMHFIAANVRATTADEDTRLGSPAGVLNRIGKATA